MISISLQWNFSTTWSLAIPIWWCFWWLCLTALRKTVHICVADAVMSCADFPPGGAVPGDFLVLRAKTSGRRSCLWKSAAAACAVALWSHSDRSPEWRFCVGPEESVWPGPPQGARGLWGFSGLFRGTCEDNSQICEDNCALILCSTNVSAAWIIPSEKMDRFEKFKNTCISGPRNRAQEEAGGLLFWAPPHPAALLNESCLSAGIKGLGSAGWLAPVNSGVEGSRPCTSASSQSSEGFKHTPNSNLLHFRMS